MSVELKYNSTQRKEYLNTMDRVAVHWLEVFHGNDLFYDAQYWDLFTKIWRSDKPVTKTEALDCMTGIKSAHTAGKYLATAIREGLLVDEPNPEDRRSRFISLSPEMKERLDVFFDRAISELRKANRLIDIQGPSPAEP
jgi:hypothetical protein